MRSWCWTVIAVVACHGRGDRSPAPAMASASLSATPRAGADAGPGPAEADGGGGEADAGLAEAGAPAIAPPAEARDPAILKVPVGPATAPVLHICFVQGDCRGTGALDQSAFVQLEQGDGISCEENNRLSVCPNLEGTIPIAEEAGFSPLCSLAGLMPSELRSAEGGRPRGQAKAELRQLVAKGAPCRGQPPGARLRYHLWCDTYRSDGTRLNRQYFGQIAGGGERMWFQDIDEQGKVTQEVTDCDAGHR